METKTLAFVVNGGYVTKLAREWFFDEKRPYDKVEEFLLECLYGTDLSREELVKIAQDILLGRGELVGSTADGSYGYQETGKAPVDLFVKFNNLLVENSSLRNQILDNIDDLDYSHVYYREDEDEDEEENVKTYVYNPQKTGYAILDEFIEQSKYENNYGWLDPAGSFYPVDWGCHQEYAKEKIEENNWEDEYDEFYFDDTNLHNKLDGDFLVYKKNWVLLHNPGQGLAYPTCREETLTKKQKEFLYNYYVDRKRDDLANKYFQEKE